MYHKGIKRKYLLKKIYYLYNLFFYNFLCANFLLYMVQNKFYSKTQNLNKLLLSKLWKDLNTIKIYEF